MHQTRRRSPPSAVDRLRSEFRKIAISDTTPLSVDAIDLKESETYTWYRVEKVRSVDIKFIGRRPTWCETPSPVVLHVRSKIVWGALVVECFWSRQRSTLLLVRGFAMPISCSRCGLFHSILPHQFFLLRKRSLISEVIYAGSIVGLVTVLRGRIHLVIWVSEKYNSAHASRGSSASSIEASWTPRRWDSVVTCW